MGIKYLNFNKQNYSLKIDSKESDVFSVEIEKKLFEVKILKCDSTYLFFETNGAIYKAKLIEKNQGHIQIYIFNFNKTFIIETKSSPKIIPAILSQSQPLIENFVDSLKSPLSGKVIKIHVQSNQFVRKNEPLIVIESMKMENEIRAKTDTFVKTIQISHQDLVQQDQLLMTFEKKGEYYAKTKVSNEQEEI
jgi:biotin carboxyl carrier protein